MAGPRKEAAGKGGASVPPKPNLPDLTKEPYLTLVPIWKAQGQVLCVVCGYQTNEQGCVWDPSHQ